MRHLWPFLLSLCLTTPADAAPTGRSLVEDPPLPGESLTGWELLDPAARAAGPTLPTLDALVALALAQHPELDAARAELDAASAGRLAARAWSGPHLEVGVADVAAPTSIEVGVTVDLTALGLALAAPQAQRGTVDAASLRAQATELRVAWEVASAWYTLSAATEAWGAALRALDALAASRDGAHARVEAGNAPTREAVLRAAAYEAQRQAAAAREVDVIQARAALTRAVGGTLPEGLPPPLRTDAPTDLDTGTLAAEARAASLELRALAAEASAARRAAGLARATALTPDVALSVAGEGAARAWDVGVGVEIGMPWFAHGTGAARAALARVAQLEARARAEAVATDAAAGVLVGRAQIAGARVDHLTRVLLPVSDAALHETLLQYDAMQVDLDALLDAWRARVDLDAQLAGARRDLWTAHAAIDALRRGLRVDAAPPPSSLPSTASLDLGGH